MALHIKTDGSITEVQPANRRSFNLQELQNYVGGYIEAVHIADGEIMMVNEEGKLHGLPVNLIGCDLFPHDIIVGDVVVGSPTEMGYGEDENDND